MLDRLVSAPGSSRKGRKGGCPSLCPLFAVSVGAAVRNKSGAIYAAANLENASSGRAICAEAAL